MAEGKKPDKEEDQRSSAITYGIEHHICPLDQGMHKIETGQDKKLAHAAILRLF